MNRHAVSLISEGGLNTKGAEANTSFIPFGHLDIRFRKRFPEVV